MNLMVHFSKLARYISHISGHTIAYIIASSLVIIWLITGPFFFFSDTWLLVMNTATSIVTFLMVFIIQNTQNREDKSMQIKLDELIRAQKGAQNVLLNVEVLTEGELEEIKKKYIKKGRVARDEKSTKDK